MVSRLPSLVMEAREKLELESLSNRMRSWSRVARKE
jgi:hypothetical protein